MKEKDSGDGGSRTRVRKPGITDIYILSLLFNLTSGSTTNKAPQEASLIKFRSCTSGKYRNYPVNVVALKESDRRDSNNTGCFIRQPMHTHNYLRLYLFPGGLTRNQDLGMPSVTPQPPSKPISSPTGNY